MATPSSLPTIPTRTLNDGTKIPLLAFGTGTALFKRTNLDAIHRPTVEYVKTALRLGIRHIDVAELYNTEPEVGVAIKESGIPRDQIFLTTKVIHTVHDIPRAINEALQRLQLDYVDLYLIHAPWFTVDDAERQYAWAEMEKVKHAGKAKSIGVSNYLQPHLESTLATAAMIPSINQLEFHPYLQRGNLVPWSESKGIATAGFGPLTTIRKASPGPCDEIFVSLAEKYGVSQEAVALRWCIEQGVVAVTTSRSEERLKDYLGAFKFKFQPDEVKLISEKGKGKHFRGNHFMHQYDPDDRR